MLPDDFLAERECFLLSDKGAKRLHVLSLGAVRLKTQHPETIFFGMKNGASFFCEVKSRCLLTGETKCSAYFLLKHGTMETRGGHVNKRKVMMMKVTAIEEGPTRSSPDGSI